MVKHMMHGPCGNLNLENSCMNKSKRCRNHYPTSFRFNTMIGEYCSPLYRRRDTGVSTIVMLCKLDDHRVVPYNPYLHAKFDCHLKVDICS